MQPSSSHITRLTSHHTPEPDPAVAEVVTAFVCDVLDAVFGECRSRQLLYELGEPADQAITTVRNLILRAGEEIGKIEAGE